MGHRGISDISPRHPRSHFQNDLAMTNTADKYRRVNAVHLKYNIVSTINPLVAFYDIHETKREVLFFFVSNTTRHQLQIVNLQVVLLYPCIEFPSKIKDE
jgi:hypothetical protein